MRPDYNTSRSIDIFWTDNATQKIKVSDEQAGDIAKPHTIYSILQYFYSDN